VGCLEAATRAARKKGMETLSRERGGSKNVAAQKSPLTTKKEVTNWSQASRESK